MWDAVVGGQLHHFGVHHDEPDLLRRGLVQQTHDQRVGAHGLTGAGGTGDQHMGQLGNIPHDGVAADVLAHGKGHPGPVLGKSPGVDDNDPIGVLDVTISSNLILDEILGIKDLRSDKRIDFVGGIRGLGELKRRVDSGEMKVALALYPVTMKQLMDIADTGNIMPPKTTWFEPKLRSGLVIHKLD